MTEPVPASAHDPSFIDQDKLVGFKFFKPLAKWLDGLHHAGCQRDKAHNRDLFMDQYLSLVLLFMFNPICSSLRALQRAGELPKVRKKLGVGRSSLGSLSEAARVFDASLLEPIIQDLTRQAKPLRHDTRLDSLGAVVTIVDGTHLSNLADIAQSLWTDGPGRGVKGHIHYELARGVPTSLSLTHAHGNEVAQLTNTLQPGRLYVLDRGYASYFLMQDILHAKSSFVVRVKDNTGVRQLIEERPIDQRSRAAGVVRDRVVTLGTPHHVQDLKAQVRLVEIHVPPHPKRPGGTPTVVWLVSDRLDLPAHVLALIFQLRWQVELFFRFFKQVLGCKHLISHCENGIRLQVYAAVIACLLMAIYTGRKPTKATAELFGWYAVGLADDDDLRRHIERLPQITN